MIRRAAVLVAIGFGIGRFPVAPATAASFAVTALLAAAAALSPGLLMPAPLAVLILVLLPLAIWTSGEAEHELGTDAKPIVVDEVVGMLVSVWGIDRLGGFGALDGMSPVPWHFLLAAFLLFRLFDILKPFPIRRSQKLPGGWGVVVDDLLAGIATNLALRLLIWAGAPL